MNDPKIILRTFVNTTPGLLAVLGVDYERSL
jgi:hypothetical protein